MIISAVQYYLGMVLGRMRENRICFVYHLNVAL